MRIRNLAAAAALGLAAGALALGGPAQADDNTVSFEDAGSVDLSGTADPAKPNAGEHVTIGSLDLGPGEWTITASVRLFVADPEPQANDGRGEWKNSQGCGIYVGGEQAAGAGGSSSLWTPVNGGKQVIFDTFLQPPDWQDVPIVLQVDEKATVDLICFIDQSHGGATFEQRGSFVATDIALTAVRPALCEVEGLGDLLADDEKCQEPDPDPSPTVEASPSPSSDPVVTGGDGGETLPVTGADWVRTAAVLAGAAVLVGCVALAAVRRKRVTFRA